MSSKIYTTATVKKANLFLLEGEDVYDFSDLIRNAVFKHINIGKDDWAWTKEITASHVIVSVENMERDRSLLRVSYSRDADGEFSFTDPIEVKVIPVTLPLLTTIVAIAPVPEVLYVLTSGMFV